MIAVARFSSDFRTYGEWYTKYYREHMDRLRQPTKYMRRIVRGHKKYPKKNLDELRGKGKIWRVSVCMNYKWHSTKEDPNYRGFIWQQWFRVRAYSEEEEDYMRDHIVEEWNQYHNDRPKILGDKHYDYTEEELSIGILSRIGKGIQQVPRKDYSVDEYQYDQRIGRRESCEVLVDHS